MTINPYLAPAAAPAPAPAPATDVQPESVDLGGGKLVPYAQAAGMVKGAANWFLWIAGLSLANFVMTASGSDTTMIVGLGIPMVVQVLSQGVDATGKVITGTTLAQVLVCGAMIGFFVWLALRGRQLKKWAFVLGMLVYTIDSLVYVISQMWLAVGFHVFVLFCLYVGVRTIGRIRVSALMAPAAPVPATTMADGAPG